MRSKVFFLFMVFPFFIIAQPQFKNYFTNNSLRYDFLLAGNNTDTEVFPAQIKKEPYWGGSKTNLIDPFLYGSYQFKIYDVKSDSLIFSKGFSTLFQEWQTTAEAKKMTKSFYQSVIFPYPKKQIRLEINARQFSGIFKTIFKTEIDPSDYFIIDEKPIIADVERIVTSGKPENSVDIAILAEGYTQFEKQKFLDDVAHLTDYLFNEPPFRSNSDKFNIYGVFTASIESGTDIPGEDIFKNTHFNSSFYTFDVDRYLTTSDMKTIYDVAANVPYDHLIVLVNSERYGGGGFYNFVSVCTASNELSEKVFVHEFGHSFTGLGDEYYSSSVAYEDFYNLKVEPWEPNLTTLVDFDKKWKTMVSDSVPVPTPRKLKFNKTVGVFEGGGYTSKGIFSPKQNCRMKSNGEDGFCPVCQKAIQATIDFYTK